MRVCKPTHTHAYTHRQPYAYSPQTFHAPGASTSASSGKSAEWQAAAAAWSEEEDTIILRERMRPEPTAWVAIAAMLVGRPDNAAPVFAPGETRPLAVANADYRVVAAAVRHLI